MKRRKYLKISIGVILIIIMIVSINSIPTWNLKTKKMHLLEGNYVNVYYEGEKNAAEDVFDLADNEAEAIAIKLGFSEKQNIAIYIYDNQSTMQQKKYGYIISKLGLHWYIGDNIGTNVILTSPANPGKVHDYNTNKTAVLHEMVHAYVSVLNPKIKLWLTEGMALYLTNGEPFNKEYLNKNSIVTYSDIQTSNPIKFSKMGGYNLAHTYIEYINNVYGWDKVLELIKTEDYEKVFGKSSKDIYIEWVEYIKR